MSKIKIGDCIIKAWKKWPPKTPKGYKVVAVDTYNRIIQYAKEKDTAE